jgi:hypothetical protein
MILTAALFVGVFCYVMIVEKGLNNQAAELQKSFAVKWGENDESTQA